MIDNASRGIDNVTIKKMKQSILDNHGVIVDTGEVKPMVLGRDRRVELGYKLAVECRKKLLYPAKNKNSRHNPLGPDGNPMMAPAV